MNKAVLIGRLTKDIELKSTPSGKSIASFTLAISRTYKNANGEYETDFINCISFGKQAELLSKYTVKGDQLAVEGRIQTRNYENKDKQKVYVTEIAVESISFLQAKKKEEKKLDPYEVFGDKIERELAEKENTPDLPF